MDIKKIITYTLVMCLCFLFTFTIDLSARTEQAQTQNSDGRGIVVKGVVLDETLQPLPGVSVIVEGTNVGSVTDIDGTWSLAVPSDDSKVVFSYLGFITETISASDGRLARVILREDTQQLEELVVVGYSTRSREKLISSISTINNKELTKTTVPNLENALTGRVSGVFSRQSSGEPGSDGANLQIRGFGAALVIVDGIPGRDYTQLDPSEIESISVLKDASAAAVYGMQAANGVILVTTKRGTKGKGATVDVSTRFGLQMPHNYPEVANTALWQELVNEYNANLKLINNRNAVINPEDMDTRQYRYDTDWYDEMIRNAPISQTNINISGGSDKVRYFVSAGYLYQGGIWSTNSIQKNRFNFRSNVDADITENLKMSVGVGAVINNLDRPYSTSVTIARQMKETAPNIPVKWPGQDEYYAFASEGKDNPMAMADKNEDGYRKTLNKHINMDFALEYKVPFVEGLSLKAVVGYNQIDNWSKDWSRDIVYMGYREDSDEYFLSASADYTDKAGLTLYDSFSYRVVGQAFVNYIRSFGDHNVNGGLIFEFSDQQDRSFWTARDKFPSTILDMMAGGLTGDSVTNGEGFRKFRAASLIGHFSYDWKSRYFVDFNFRYDGAQYFADKWGFFPSVSVGWMLTNEDFMEPAKNVLNELKIRASWGQLGDLSSAQSYYNDNEQYYHQSGYKYPGAAMVFGDRDIYGLTQTVNANPDFTWSTATMMNAGADFRLWDGMLSGSADFFYRKRDGLPAMMANDNSGVLATYYNLNGDNTRGFELQLDHSNRIGDFSYTVGGNLSWSRTRFGHVEHGQYTSGYSEWRNNNEGHWKNVRWGYNVLGQYQSYDDIANAPMHDNSNNNSCILPGDLKYEDWNGDGYITIDDQQPIGRSAYPELVYGINVSLAWKGLDFSMLWQGGALSNFQLGTFDSAAFNEGQIDNNVWAYFSDRWHKSDYTDPNAEWIPGHFPALRDFTSVTINKSASNFWTWNGNYLRLKNVELGYTLPQKWTQKARIKQLRVYVNAYNALTFSAQKYFDPELAEGGWSLASYPQIMSFNAGINLKF